MSPTIQAAVCGGGVVIPIALIPGQNAAASGTDQATATYPGTPTQGHYLVACVSVNVAAGVAAMSGWTLLSESGSGSLSVSIWGKVAGAAESTSVTVTTGGTGTVTKLHVYEFSGVNTGSPVRGTPLNQSTTSNTTFPIGPVTAVTGDYVISAVSVNGTITVPAVAAPLALLQADASAIRLFDGGYAVNPGAAISSTASWTTARVARSVMLVLKP